MPANSPRVRHDFGGHRRVRSRPRLLADRTRRCGRPDSHLQALTKQALHRAVGRNQHHEIGGLDADLKAGAPSRDGDESRGAPPMGCRAGDDPVSVLGADEKARSHQRRSNHDAPGPLALSLRDRASIARFAHDDGGVAQFFDGALSVRYARVVR
jgi:hypothetical protein